MEEEGKGCDNDSTTSLIVHGYSTCGTLSTSAGEHSSTCEGSSMENSSSHSSGLAESTDVMASSSDSLQDDDKPLFVFTSQSNAQVTNANETEVEIPLSISGNSGNDASDENSSQEINLVSGVEASHESKDSALHTDSEEGSSRNNEELEPSEMEVSESEADTPETNIQMNLKTQVEMKSLPNSVVEDDENTNLECRDTETVDDGPVIGDQVDVCKADQEIQSPSHQVNVERSLANSIESTLKEKEEHKHVDSPNKEESTELSVSQACEETDQETVEYKEKENPETEEKVSNTDNSKDDKAMTQEKLCDTGVQDTPSSSEEEKIEPKDSHTSILTSHHSTSSSKSLIEGWTSQPTHTKKLVKPRESYYSSLEVINVNETNIFDEFTMEEKNNPHELEQIIHATDKNIFPLNKDQQRRSTLKKYSSSTCEFLSEGSDSVFTPEAQNMERHFPSTGSDVHLCSSSEVGRNFPDTPSSRNSEGDDSVFIHKSDTDNDVCATYQLKREGNEESDSVSPITPPPKGPVMKTDAEQKYIFTVTPPPNSIRPLRKIIPLPLISVTSSHSSLSHNLGESGIESYGPANRAIIFSQSIDSDPASFSSQPATPVNAEDQYLSDYADGSREVQVHDSPMSHSRGGSTFDYMPNEDLNSSSEDNSDGESSPDQKFNDTIEEMEMMLKYGLNYGEVAKAEADKAKGEIPSSEIIAHSTERKSHGEHPDVEDNDEEFESIVSPRKSSVASTISNFQPNMDSTRSSLREDVEKPKIFVQSPEAFDTNKVWSPSVTSNKKQKEAPPKPPRNINLQNFNSPKHPVEAHTKMQKRSPVSKPISVSRPKPSPLSFTPKVSKLDSTKTLVVKQPGSRVVNDPGIYRSGSLTNIYKTSKVGESHVSTPVRTASGFRSQPNSPLTKTFTPLKKNSPSEISARLHSGKTGLPPRPPVVRANIKPNLPSQIHQINKFSTPQGKSTRTKMQISSASKIQSPSMRTPNNLRFKQGMSIVSPVAKYLKENPPPPLVVNIKPRHKISPVKVQSESPVSLHTPLTSSQNSPQRLVKKIHREDADVVQRKAALQKIQGDLDKLASKMSNAQVNISLLFKYLNCSVCIPPL